MVVTKLGHNQIVTSFYTGVTVVSASMLYMRGISVLNLNGWPLSLRKGLLGWGTEAVAAEKVRGSFTSPSLWSHQLSLLLYRWYLLLLLSLPEMSDSKRLELVCASSEPLLSRCEGRRCLLLQVTLFCNLLLFSQNYCVSFASNLSSRNDFCLDLEDLYLLQAIDSRIISEGLSFLCPPARLSLGRSAPNCSVGVQHFETVQSHLVFRRSTESYPTTDSCHWYIYLC